MAQSVTPLTRSMKSAWVSLAQLAAWLFGIVSVFVIDPPELWSGAPNARFSAFARFFIAVISGLVLIACRRYRAASSLRYWVLAVIVATTVGTLSLFSYYGLSANWTCWWAGTSYTVIGSEYLPAAAAAVSQHMPHASCSQIIQSTLGLTYQLWDQGEIIRRYLILVALFVAATTLLSVAVISLLQALRCGGVVRG
jgi:hypothetical protein